jgi:hypothetical protein
MTVSRTPARKQRLSKAKGGASAALFVCRRQRRARCAQHAKILRKKNVSEIKGRLQFA